MKTARAMKRPASQIIDEVAMRWGVTVDEMKNRQKHPTLNRARAETYQLLQNELGWSLRQIGMFMGNRTGSAIKQALDNLLARPSDPELEADLLRFRINQLSGIPLLPKITNTFEVNTSQAIVLSIIIENYPKGLSLNAMCELYDHAWHTMTGENDRFVLGATLKSIISKLRKIVTSQGYSMPIETTKNGDYVLTKDFAFWSRINLGRPHAVGM